VSRALLVTVLCWMLAGCGGTSTERSPVAGIVHRQVGIGGGRSLYLQCAGSGSPTVVLESGFGTPALQWQDVQPMLARTTRVCAYDRAGTGSSVAPPGVRDARDEIADLRQLLARARIGPPYVFVGHSYGGVLARVFASRHSSDTVGLVLLDTMGRDGRQRQLAIWPRSQAPEMRRELAMSVLDGIDLGVGEALASRITTFGDMPLAVVTAGREDHFPRRPPHLARGLRRLWNTMQDELTLLSSNSVHVVAQRSDHDIASGQPSVVVTAVDAVVRAARDGTRLPPCSRIFSGPAVGCRGG
jgi:pimeloyl-ACP methyl ester carboxylesterase